MNMLWFSTINYFLSFLGFMSPSFDKQARKPIHYE